MKYKIDDLFEAVASKGHVCIGLDTSIEYVPKKERKKEKNDAKAVLDFNKALIDTTHDITACYKVQIAYYEEMGTEGLKTYSETLKYLRKKGCISIGDIKRGDIADTAIRYVKAHYNGEFQADFVTINPYMGMDSVEPWIKEAHEHSKGAFILMRTSNKGMRDFQYLNAVDTESSKPEPPTRLYNKVGEKMAALANKYKGSNGYGMFGVVVGCTEQEEAAEIRKNFPNLFFLIPGYGAQGGAAQDVALLLRNGNGGVVNASRSIITAWKVESQTLGDVDAKATYSFAAQAARRATLKMRDEIRGALK